jgi:hypothetical protein
MGKYPLAMPKGSVRAIVVLAFVAATIVGVMATLGQANVPASLAALFALVGPIITNYFRDRRDDTSEPKA